MALKLQQQLKELGAKLENPPTTKDALLKLLKQAATCLSEVDQSPTKSMLESMQPFLNSIAKPDLLKHQDREVKLLVATCVCEITRVTAPEAPYSDDVLKDIFHLIVSTFSGLSDTSGPSFGRRVVILETLARYRSCVVMLDLECDDLVNQMFSTFFSVASDDHPESVIKSMQTIMVVLLEESEEIREDLLLVLLSVLGRNRSDCTMAARRLSINVIEQCAGKLEPGIKQFLISSMSGDSRSLNGQMDYHEIIYDIYRCAPQILSGVVPYLTGELLTDQLDTRLKAVRLVGDLFALPGSAFSEPFQPIFLEFLKRLTDRVVEVRMSVLDRAKICLLSNPFRSEAPQIISALCDRLLDYDENVRQHVVAVVCDVACHALASVTVETVKLVAERLRDKSLLVKRYTMERLAEIYRIFCLSQSVASTKTDDFDWIPGKILRCFYDKDFRSDAIEPILCRSLFPDEFSVKERVGCWIRVFSGFDKVEVKALEKILEQKQRFQQEMQKYFSLRQMHQETEVPEFQKKILFCFRIMSRCFTDPAKAEENFQILDQLKDANIWKILTTLLDPDTSSLQACSCRDDLLKILGEKHRLYDFLTTVSLKCSYLLFNKHHVKEILLEADLQKSAGHTQFTLACMNILVILAHFSPLLLNGIEEDLVHLLKDDNEVIKEGVLHVLANAGGTIQEQLGVSSSSLDLILERICLEGSRRQAKYAVHALAAITKDDGLMSLSVLYKRLVDMLEEKTHLPAVLQSLGCIAQTAMSVFETRESEIEGFIKRNILECNNKVEEQEKDCWDDRSELCSLKIFGIKTLVKSYLPVKDAHLRLGIDSLLDILKNILSFGEISNVIESSPVDKAHLRLAAAKSVLRLSKHWDHKIPVNLFYLTLRTLEINFPQAKKQFLSKVHQYIKERLLDPKYACAFLLDISKSQQPEFEEGKHNLSDIIQTCQQGKARQISLQCDANSVVLYPEYILPYLVHALAHHSSCPNVDECRDVKAFEPVYRQLHLFFSMLIHGDEDGKSEGSIEKDKESICAILSILQCIKCSEDTLDPTKSKNSHGICDLGLSITKRLAQKEDDLQGSIVSVSLPPMLYKPHDKKEVDDPLVNEGQTWLAEKSVLTHFESLKLEVNGTIHPEVVDDVVLEDSETDGNEVPLGKMIKRLKAKGIKARKEMKTEPLQAGTKNEDGVDILQMVREINLDNLGTSGKLEVSNGHDYLEKKIDQKYRKRKERVASETTNVPVPKRRRSSPQVAYKFSLSRKTSKGSKSTSIDDLPREEGSSFESPEKNDELHVGSEDKMSLQENMVEPAESDLLVTCFWKNSNSLPKHKSRSSDKDQRDKAHKVGEIDDYDVKINKPVETDSMKAISYTTSSTASGKKRKRRSIAGLAKCTSKEGGSETMDLINCRIKIWWPMDKKFYEGLVKSYDSQKKKHVVLYDDGDVEVLRLEKERWELVDNGRKQKQRSKTSKSSPHKGSISEQKKKFLSSSQQSRNSINISSPCKVRGKRTPRRNLKHGLRGGLKIQTSSGLLDADNSRSPGIPDPEPAEISKLDDMNSGDSEGEHIETGEKSFTGGEESDEDQKSDSEGKLAGDAENVPSDVEESEQEKPNFEVTSHDTRRSTEEGSPRSEEKQQDVSRDGSGEEGKAEQSDSQGTDADDSESNPTNPDRSGKKTSTSSDSGEAEISEDRPLSTWKRRVAKPVQGK
ncbi:sister chromatid cohesion protein PDS5 homolog A-like isoform X2 [Actinidia eriantha]|uniref:sister chromatid cohesion protein PDS5 homolog A-like isoform X2 n=1 Tax=Actinidia eriantha TaxID=165200 RepID=UPI002590A7D6|nr:sister chromatid cohesion protein PDS5 homolog A-like isoform X2 [Actinidia eriantha]